MPDQWHWRHLLGGRISHLLNTTAHIPELSPDYEFGKPLVRRRKETVVVIDIRNAEPMQGYADWDVLRADIQEACGDVVPWKARAYRRVTDDTWANREFLDRAIAAWKMNGYEFRYHPSKDVDMLIASDLTMWMDELLEQNDEVELNLILVSGDGDFAPFIRNKKSVHKKRLKLNLTVYGWEKSLSRRLLMLAGAANVRYLDDLPGFVKEPAIGK